MDIIGVGINGYKNIRDTYLDFSEHSLIVLFAPNNYGKTNLVNGIEAGFELLRQHGKSFLYYAKSKLFGHKDDVENFPLTDFSFEIDFKTSKASTEKYKYKVQIHPVEKPFKRIMECGEEREIKVVTDVVVVHESLTRTDANSLPLFMCDGGRKSLHLQELAHLPNMSSKVEINAEHVEDIKVIKTAYECLTTATCGNNIASGENFYGHAEPVVFLESDLGRLLEKNKYEKFREYFCGFEKDEDGEKINGMFKYYDMDILPSSVSNRVRVKLTDTRRNPQTNESIRTVSFGTKRIFKLLAQMCINSVPLISVEELENGLNPKVFREFIAILEKCLKEGCTETKLLVSTHSPNVIDRFGSEKKLKAVYLGVPSIGKEGYATFKHLNEEGRNEVVSFMENSEEGHGAGVFILSTCIDEMNSEFAEKKGWFK